MKEKSPQSPLYKSPRSGISIGADFKSSCKSVREHTVDMPDQRDQEIGSFKLVVHKMQDNLFEIFFDDITEMLRMQQNKSDLLY